MRVPPLQLFKSMLGFAAEGKPEQMIKSLEFLKPVLDEQEHFVGKTSLEAVWAKITDSDPTTVQQGLRALLAQDVVTLLRSLKEFDLMMALPRIKAAGLEWNLLVGHTDHPDVRIVAEVSALFRDLEYAVAERDRRAMQATSDRIALLVRDF